MYEISSAAASITGGGVGFFTGLYEVNLVLGFIASCLGICVAGHALYQIYKAHRRKP